MIRRLRIMRGFVSVVLRGVVRDRTALFFMIVLPVAIIVIIGATFGGVQRLDIGVVQTGHGAIERAIVGQLDRADGIRVRMYRDLASMRSAVRRGTIAAGIVVDPSLDARAAGAGMVDVPFVTNTATAGSFAARNLVDDALGHVGARVAAARFAVTQTGTSFATALATAERLERRAPIVAVKAEDVGSGRVRTFSRFSLTAPQNLVLFVFVNAAASGAALVRMRNSGVLRRALASPIGSGTVVAGIGLGWLAIAVLQSLIIVGVGALVFGVNWGDPVAAIVLIVVYALVGSGAGLLIGAIGRSEDRVSAIAPVTGLVLGALGGCMVPLEIFPPTMRAIAHVVPQFWAITAWQHLVFDGAGLGDVMVPVLVLAVFAAVFLGFATTVLRRDLAQG
jgi:ABC-2 type transport system permease protein